MLYVSKLCTNAMCYYSLYLTGPPELPFKHNQVVTANVSEEVILNCTVSSSPDSVYSWSIPDSCPFCQQSYNNSIMLLNPNISNSGLYICVAKNEYGNISRGFSLYINCK